MRVADPRPHPTVSRKDGRHGHPLHQTGVPEGRRSHTRTELIDSVAGDRQRATGAVSIYDKIVDRENADQESGEPTVLLETRHFFSIFFFLAASRCTRGMGEGHTQLSNKFLSS